ncbi:zinc ribbon domain-containing protein [Sinimarinibacterium flocculans]|uniref:zinc ribbon domain-containing protein n=1 Tax=Sinimarinibacterium flocculans TaxID=985250 RepID=UPI0035129EF6
MSGVWNDPCPKCAYLRRPEDASAPGECPRCGVYYEKFLQRRARVAMAAEHAAERAQFAQPPWRARLWGALWYTPERVDQTAFVGRCLVLAAIVVWGVWFIAQPVAEGRVMYSFLHNVDLAFHEFGHLLFMPFGEWMMFLGGSLFQCLLPLMLAAYFVFRQHQPFSAAVCLWWCGQNVIDVAPYIADARALALPLIGEWSEEMAQARALRHDWHNLLAAVGALHLDRSLAGLAQMTGALLMLTSWVWGALLLRLQYRQLSGDVFDER